jgi:hypothetical protein
MEKTLSEILVGVHFQPGVEEVNNVCKMLRPDNYMMISRKADRTSTSSYV